MKKTKQQLKDSLLTTCQSSLDTVNREIRELTEVYDGKVKVLEEQKELIELQHGAIKKI